MSAASRASRLFATALRALATRSRPRTSTALVTASGVATTGVVTALTVYADVSPLRVGEFGGWTRLSSSDDDTAALNSAESLVALAADRDNHPALIASGAVDALCIALERALKDHHKDIAVPLAANACRALADLARSSPAALNQQVPKLMRHTLLTFPVPKPPAWWPWGTDVQQTDLAAGISHHAVRCVSNLARESANHEALLEAGVLQIVADVVREFSVNRVKSVVDNEARLLDTCRSAVLAVAAIAKSYPQNVVASGALKRLVQLAAAADDAIVQTYAAAGLRNLARADDSSIHREIVVCGAPNSIKLALMSDTPQVQVFAALALADLLTTKHPKAHLIRDRLAVTFDALANCVVVSNQAVAHAALRCAHLAFEQMHIPKLGDALIPKLTQLVQGPVRRGDVVTIRTLASMAGEAKIAQALVEAGAVEVLRDAVQRGRGPYFDEASRAVSSLAAHPNVAQVLADKGALAAALKRPSTENDGLCTVALVANAAKHDELRARVAHAALHIVLRAARKESDENARRQAVRALYNLSQGGASRIMVAQSGALTPLVALARSEDCFVVQCAVGAIAAISSAYEYATRIVECDTIAALLEADAKHNDDETRRNITRTLAHIASNEATHGSLAPRAIPWLCEIVRSNGGRGRLAPDTMYFALIALCNLAYSPGITRKTLRESGVVSTLAALASGGGVSAPELAHAARQTLVNLREDGALGMIAVDNTGREDGPK